MDTASRWNAKRLPNGKALNKLWFLLEAHELEVKELEKLLPEARYIARLVAFDVLTKEAALTELRLEGGTADYLWRVLQGKLIPLAIQKKTITTNGLTRKYGLALGAALPLANAVSTPTKDQSAKKPPTPGEMVARGSHISVAAAFISGLLPLIRRVNEEGLDSVAALRAEIDEDVFYAVLDGLKAMSGRRAHEFYHGKVKNAAR